MKAAPHPLINSTRTTQRLLLLSFPPPGPKHTVDEDNGFLNGVLVVELRVEQRLVEVHAVVCALVPADVQVIHVYVTQVTHHFHLVLDCSEMNERLVEQLPNKKCFVIWSGRISAITLFVPKQASILTTKTQRRKANFDG